MAIIHAQASRFTRNFDYCLRKGQVVISYEIDDDATKVCDVAGNLDKGNVVFKLVLGSVRDLCAMHGVTITPDPDYGKFSPQVYKDLEHPPLDTPWSRAFKK